MVINAKEFLEAIDEIERSKGISREVVISSLIEAMKKGYKKELGGDDAEVEVIIEPEKGIIEMYNVKDIVEEVEDDFLQISPEDAEELRKEGKALIKEDKCYISASIESLRKATATSIKSILKQKFAEAEKSVLYEAFKDKIGTMITGRVEKVDERGCSVNIGRTSVYLRRKQMIGDERFYQNDEIRLFVDDVASGSKGAQIVVSRASEGFLKALFFEEIREVYDGTIIIKNIAREAGERSKVAVYSTDPTVDPAGACIGQNGKRIQKIVSQLGNGQAKEKIDIIAYSDNVALYVMEALKPARVVGINLSLEDKSATVVVKDDSLSLAIGKKGVNARLAVRLTGINIDVKTETEAIEEEFAYQSLEELQAEEDALRAQKIEEQRQLVASHEGETIQGIPEGYVAPQERVYADEVDDMDQALREKVDQEEDFIPETDSYVAPIEEAPVEEEAPVVDATPVETIKEVKTTTTIEDLEKSLESDSTKSTTKKGGYKKGTKKKTEEEEEDTSTVVSKKDPSTYMSIYTEEELKEMEEEEEEEDTFEDEEDVDYDEYDEYYDDDDK